MNNLTPKQLESKVRKQTSLLLSSEDTNEREEVIQYILLNQEVAALVLLLLAEAVRPIIPDVSVAH